MNSIKRSVNNRTLGNEICIVRDHKAGIVHKRRIISLLGVNKNASKTNGNFGVQGQIVHAQ